MLNLLFIMISSLAIGEDVLKIYTFKYEISDCAAREANPPVNAGDLSSVDRPAGLEAGNSHCAPRVEGSLI